MGSLREEADKAGNPIFKLTITRTKQKHRETRSFRTETAARAWEKKREAELDATVALGKPLTKQRNEGKTLGDAIDKYITEQMKEIGRTKTQVLQTIRNEYDISKMRCDQITSQDIVAFAKELHFRPKLNSAATVMNYVSHLQAVFAIAKDAWDFPLDITEMQSAQRVCSRLGITKKAIKRTRRPTLDELDILLTHFQLAYNARANGCPMHLLSIFALFSTRRQAEIERIEWADYDRINKRIWVRDMKHPGDKIGNDVPVLLPDPCCDIIDSMPKISPRIFPHSTYAMSANWTRACQFHNIKDLHFHDLRHEGVSRLFEMGKTLPEAASVSGHRSWSSLQRYTHIITAGDKYENWKWIKVATDPTSHNLNPQP
ncbi:MAG: Phage integrase family protein [Cypionkella sp.]|uniref:site-specific integrase n=1 Tax=Cypionkella sp. TaxID=2811411 RepID=UPI00263241EE|nr:site-specific integrase [Cypionkella sp.]MDB5660697.1 Phage integrase family protein [Cypionkella sp.]